MKKKRKITIFIALLIIFTISLVTVIYRFLQDENQLNVTEKRYIINNKSNLINVSILNDSNVFGSAGRGVFYDFLSNLEDENDLSFNVITTSVNSNSNGLRFDKSSSYPNGTKIIYEDHYVLMGKTLDIITNPKDIINAVGVLNKDLDLVRNNLSSYSLTIKNYETQSELLDGLKNDEIKYVIVPNLEYLDVLLSNLYYINYHFSDIKDYYYIGGASDNTLNSIVYKTYNIWSETNFDKSFNTNEYNLFVDKLKITEKEMDQIKGKEYNYGFLNGAPYNIKNSGVFGGIIGSYLKRFSNFSGFDINYMEYDNINKLSRAIGNGKVDLYTNLYNINSGFTTLDSYFYMDLSVVMSLNDSRIYTSVNSLKNEEVYIKENSTIEKALNTYGIKYKTYKKQSDVKKLLKQKNIVIMDAYEYKNYTNDNALERFVINTKIPYAFYSSNDTMFNRLFTYYMMIQDKNEIIVSGLKDYNNINKSGTIIYKITKYAIFIVLGIALLIYLSYIFGKKVHFKKKIKKSDKMKYIDMLTSLKNRNFLSENLSIWNQNTIYPQSIIVIDLNGVQELNDSFGYNEGDKQIKAAANVLIKTQLDNSEIMRTDGNEFTIYLMGYNEKQIISYIKKLNKEFKNLPHDKGAAIGFSMIVDDLKLIGDAINEATEKMKQNKNLQQGDEDETEI